MDEKGAIDVGGGRRRRLRELIYHVIYQKVQQIASYQRNFPFVDVDIDFDIVYTLGMCRFVDLLLRCVKHMEPALFVEETGTWKTTDVEVVAALIGRKPRILNCQQHIETSDFLAAMRTVKPGSQRLFEVG